MGYLSAVNREKLSQWLQQPTQTWRWNEDVVDIYEGADVTEQGLTYFRWSHDAEAGGRTELGSQTARSFLEGDPSVEMPPHIVAEIRAWFHERGL